MKPLAVIGALVALAAAGSSVGTSAATFTAHESFTGTVTTASDWVAPSLTLTAPADGSYRTSTTVTVSGAAGNATGDDTTVTLNLYSGSSASGTPILTRTVNRSGATWSTTLTGLGQATYTVQATQSDSADNTTTTPGSTFTVDTVAPTRVSVTAVNGSGNAGRLDAGDTITYTYSEPIQASTVLSGWSGASATGVNVRFFSSSTDGFTILDSNKQANVKLDAGTTGSAGVSLGSGANYVSNTVTFTGTMTQSADDKSFTIVLTGSSDNASKISTTAASAARLTWTPKSGPTDLAANALTISSWTETTAVRHF